MKKIFSLLIVFALFISIFAGCANEESGKKSFFDTIEPISAEKIQELKDAWNSQEDLKEYHVMTDFNVVTSAHYFYDNEVEVYLYDDVY